MSDTYVGKNYFTDGGDPLVIGGTLTVTEDATVEGISDGGSAELPTASADTLGGIKVGNNLVISEGVLSVPTATTTTPGVVKQCVAIPDCTAGNFSAFTSWFNESVLAPLRAAGIIATATE